MLNKNCGIYKITSPTGRVYIGQSENITSRIRNYSGLQAKGQPRLYASLKKYGWKNHQFDIIEYCLEEELNCSERFWQDEFDVLSKNGLNCVLQECGVKRKKYSEESIKNKSLNHPTAVKVIDTDTLIIYNSITQTAKEFDMRTCTLCLQLNGKYKSKTTLMLHSEYLKGKKELNRYIYAYKVIDIVTKTVYKNPKQASKALDIKYSTLLSKLNGKYNNNTDLVFLNDFLNDVKIVKKLNTKHKRVIDTATGYIYKTIVEASEVFGINKHTLGDYLNGYCKNKTTLKFYNE